MNYVPLIERVEATRDEDGETPRVWYRVSPPGAAQALRGKLHPGNWVLFLARVNAVRSSGLYVTGEKPPGATTAIAVDRLPVGPGLELRLERSEIFLVPSAVTDGLHFSVDAPKRKGKGR